MFILWMAIGGAVVWFGKDKLIAVWNWAKSKVAG